MPHTRSAMKRLRQNRVRNLRNRAGRSATKTWMKKLAKSVKENDPDVQSVLRRCIATIDKAASKGILHRNTAARRKALAYKMVNAAKGR